jgi:hypothetical protein
MYSTNNHNSEQNYIYCRNECGARITFNDYAISKNGKKIPLQENGLPHNCPNSYFNKRQELPGGTRFAKEIDNTERHATNDSQDKHRDSSPSQEQHSARFNKINLEQQQYVDTIGPAVAEILSVLARILSLLQEIRQYIVQEGNKKG